jgi:hypothetical protein
VVCDCIRCVYVWIVLVSWLINSPVTMFVFGVVVVEVYHPDFPVWAFVLALLICEHFMISS